MNKDKLPIKYHIGVWKTLPGYPSKQDVLYEITAYMERKSMTEFSEQTLNGIWYDQQGVANWAGTAHEEVVNSMIESGTIKVSRVEDSGKEWYTIAKKQEWMD